MAGGRVVHGLMLSGLLGRGSVSQERLRHKVEDLLMLEVTSMSSTRRSAAISRWAPFTPTSAACAAKGLPATLAIMWASALRRPTSCCCG
jgi:hypothetical protein